jgi:hypothetical protein
MKKSTHTRVEDIKHLKKLLADGKPMDFLMQLGGGLVVSRKTMELVLKGKHKGDFIVYNHIDDSEDYVTEKELMDKEYTNIGEAIEKGAYWTNE